MNVILLGPPGAGKGTMAERVRDIFKLAHISTGDLLRAEIKSGSELGKLAAGYIDKGALVPDDVIISMIQKRMLEDDAKNGVLLDGFPRTLQQAKTLDEQVHIDSAILLDATLELVKHRILSRRVCPECAAVYSANSYKSDTCSCGAKLITRADDNEETVEKRFNVYLNNTEPLVGFYKEKGVLSSIDADGDIADIVAAIEKILKAYQ